MKRISHNLFEKIDLNQDGVLDRGEFLRYALLKFEFVEVRDLEMIDHLFDSFDKNKTGTLAKNDIVAGCDQQRSLRRVQIAGDVYSLPAVQFAGTYSCT